MVRTRITAIFIEVDSASSSIDRIILWCLERLPHQRPTAEQLLASELLPRVIELEQRYLEEALSVLTRPQVRHLMIA